MADVLDNEKETNATSATTETKEKETTKKETAKVESKTYRGPTNHAIGNVVQFVNGFYSTADKKIQKLIESDMLYGTKIIKV